jgi:hypothetical protein
MNVDELKAEAEKLAAECGFTPEQLELASKLHAVIQSANNTNYFAERMLDESRSLVSKAAKKTLRRKAKS